MTRADLVAFANRLDSRGTFPRIIRLLLSRAAPGARIDFRSDEGVSVPGYDGEVFVEATGEGAIPGWVPIGRSVWELGTGNNPSAKMIADGQKRSETETRRDETTLVLVAAREVRDKAKVRDALAGANWKGIETFDVDDIVGWLDADPHASAIVADWIGKPVRGVTSGAQDLAKELQRTTPKLTKDLLLAGRETEFNSLVTAMADRRRVTVRARSRREAKLFVLSALEELKVIERVLCVTDTGAVYSGGSSTDIHLAMDKSVADELSLRASGTVIEILTWDDVQGPNVDVKSLWPHKTTVLFRAAGLEHKVAEKASVKLSAGVNAFLRAYGDSGANYAPWTRATKARQLAPFALCGEWLEQHDQDWAFIGELAGLTPADAKILAHEFLNQDDPPLEKIGNGWRVIDRPDVWNAIDGVLDADILGRFVDAAFLLLENAPTPQGPPSFIRIYWPQEPEGHSSLLRASVAKSLALLGARNRETHRLESGVRSLLKGAIGDRWRTFSPYLEWLAEAAPDAFLDALEDSLRQHNPAALSLFDEDREQLLTSSSHTNLLWSLERLAWLKPHLLRSAKCLAVLSQREPGGRSGNRPNRSLVGVFRPWGPQTSASRKERWQVIDRVVKDVPSFKLPLLLSLLPSSHESWSPHSRPFYRVVKHSERTWSTDVALENEAEVLHRLCDGNWLTVADWVPIVEKIGDLSPAGVATMGEALRKASEVWSDKERSPVFQSLRELIASHEAFPEADWSLPAPVLASLEPALDALAPTHPVYANLWLFGDQVTMRGHSVYDYDGTSNLRGESRTRAIRLWLGDWDHSLSLALNAGAGPEFVGAHLVKATEGEPWVQLATAVHSDDERMNRVGRAAVRELSWTVPQTDLYPKLREYFGQWSPQARRIVLGALHVIPATWDLAEEFGDEEAYWKAVPPDQYRGGVDQPERFVGSLIKHGNADAAITYLGGYRGDDAELLPGELYVAGLSAFRNGETPVTSDSSVVGRVLERLRRTAYLSDQDFMRMEILYLDVVTRGHTGYQSSLALTAAKDPQAFLDLHRYMRTGEMHKSYRVKFWSLFHDGMLPPGMVDGQLDPERFRAYMEEVRRIVTADDEGFLGALGRALAKLPPDEVDGIWPPTPLREELERFTSEELEESLIVGKTNLRGATMRMPYDGGGQERSLSSRYHEHATQMQRIFPRTTRILQRLADFYASDAEREDLTARWGHG